MEEKILQHFLDIPTTTQAIEKLKSLRLKENKSILVYNQRYKVLVDRVEGRPIQEVQSAVVMEMYLGTIIMPLHSNIKDYISWNSKYAPKNLGEAMKKSEELYVKHFYSSIVDQEEYINKKQQEVVINDVNYGDRRDFRRERYEDKCKKSNFLLNYGKHDGWSSNYKQRNTESRDNSNKSLSSQNDKQEHDFTWMELYSG